MTKTLLLAMSLALLLAPRAGEATPLSVCKTQCLDEVWASCAFLRKAKLKRCRVKIWNVCRRGFLDCDPPVTTTTPTRPPTTTTSSSTTTTTASRPATTTTTTLPYGPWTGTWDFFGTLSENTCPSVSVSYYARDTFYIVQQGSAFTVTIASFPDVVMTGTWNDLGGITVTGSAPQEGCTAFVALVTDGSGNVAIASANAGVGLGVSCGGVTCRATYLGTIDR